MHIYRDIILNLILILFPILIYLIWMAYDSNINKKNNIFLLDMALITSIYLIFEYGNSFLLTFNIPLIIAYVKKRKLAIIFITLMIIRNYYLHFDLNIYYIIYEYLFYGLLSYLFNNKVNAFIILTLITKIFIYSTTTHNTFIMMLIISIIFIVTTLIILFMLSRVERVMELHIINKRIKKDEEFRTSLFKITHEIKNPIAVIKGYLDMFDVNNVKHSKKYVPIMKDEVNRLLILLEDFLSMNKIKVNKEILDINLLLEEAIDKLDSVILENNIDVSVELYDDEIYVEGDFNRLTQVIVNIIKNSIEAKKEKNAHIFVKTSINEDKVFISIRDNGMGIHASDLKRISEPFFTTKKRGTGLGVSLSYEIIEAHSGTIKYESEYGEYTLVSISLPRTEIM